MATEAFAHAVIPRLTRGDRGTTLLSPRGTRGHRDPIVGVPRRAAFRPFEFLQEPGAWDTDNAAWKTPHTDDEAALLAVAMLQHRLSRRVWSKMALSNLRVADLAETIGHGEDQLWRKLAGKVPAGTHDLCLWAFLTGDDDAIAGVTKAFVGRRPVWPVR